MEDRSRPQYLNPDGSFTRKRPGLPKRYDSKARALAQKMTQDPPRKIDPEAARKIAEALKMFLKNDR
ncbi:MAG: hypothetical protein OCD01_15175 [Fibrobacterales bacterium]